MTLLVFTRIKTHKIIRMRQPLLGIFSLPPLREMWLTTGKLDRKRFIFNILQISLFGTASLNLLKKVLTPAGFPIFFERIRVAPGIRKLPPFTPWTKAEKGQYDNYIDDRLGTGSGFNFRMNQSSCDDSMRTHCSFNTARYSQDAKLEIPLKGKEIADADVTGFRKEGEAGRVRGVV